MSDAPARTGSSVRRWLPWLTAGVLAVVVVLIAVTLPYVRGVSARAQDAAQTVALPTDYQAAMQAAATEAANILTYSRKNFDADWNRALAGATGKLRTDQEAKRANTLDTMTKNKIDLKAKVQQFAFESADESGHVLVLVTVNGYTVSDAGTPSPETPQRLELTMVKSGGKWLASDLTMIGIQ